MKLKQNIKRCKAKYLMKGRRENKSKKSISMVETILLKLSYYIKPTAHIAVKYLSMMFYNRVRNK